MNGLFTLTKITKILHFLQPQLPHS